MTDQTFVFLYRFSHNLLCACLVLLLVATGVSVAHAQDGQGICRVSTVGIDSNNGADWTTPTQLQSALRRPGCTEIWVAAGLYRPVIPVDPINVTPAEQAVSFEILPGVAVYGGFAGTETGRNQRDAQTNLSVLSGDIDANDAADADGITGHAEDIAGSNSAHVVLMDGTATTGKILADTVLDGFTVTAGSGLYSGGGFICNGLGESHECSPTLANLRFIGNEAGSGGAVLLDGRDGGATMALLSRIVFHNNLSWNGYGAGGALSILGNDGGMARPTLVDVVFTGNVASNIGGAIAGSGLNLGDTSAVLNRVTFSDNKACGAGGGAVYAVAVARSHPMELTNVTFSGNSTGRCFDEWGGGSGGAISWTQGPAGPAGAGTLSLTNVTFHHNQIGGGFGSAIYSDAGAVALQNVILWGDSGTGAQAEIALHGAAVATVSYSLIEGSGGSGAGWDASLGTDGGNNLDANPLFGLLQNHGGFTDTLLPGAGSPAIDGGTCMDAPLVDQRGAGRPQGATCDIGSVEAFATGMATFGDAGDYARYGSTRIYVLTLNNRNNNTASDFTVSSAAPMQIDPGAMRWRCVGSPGVSCTAYGSGPLLDGAVTIPAYGFATWWISVPVLPDAPGDVLTMGVDVTGMLGRDLHVEDTDTLVLFRAGFDVAHGDGTMAVPSLVPRQ